MIECPEYNNGERQRQGNMDCRIWPCTVIAIIAYELEAIGKEQSKMPTEDFDKFLETKILSDAFNNKEWNDLRKNKLSDILNSNVFKKHERFVDSPFCLHKCGKGNQT